MRTQTCLVAALALALVANAADAQYPYPPPPPGDAASQAAAPLLAPQQLDQMVASIALYPDPLLTDVLTAATYPLEVVEAARWLQFPQNAQLYDGALAAALDGQGWDPSVKSLVPFPQVLRLMDAHLDWTQALGNAFLAQQADVMDSIQRLRHEAQASGMLGSNAQQAVIVDGPYIAIEPASPQLVFVPVYSPFVVYGRWPYPADPPIYYGPPPGFPLGLASAGIGFAAGIAIVDVLWHWGDWDWRDHRVHVDPDRFNRINAGRPPIATTAWQHDPGHRRGAPYGDTASRTRFEPPRPGTPEQRQDFRFYGGQQASVPPQRSEGGQSQARPALPQAAAPATVPHPVGPTVTAPPPPQTPHVAPPVVASPPPPQVGRPATVFEGSHGPEAQAHAQRGQESRQSAAPAAAPAAAVAPHAPPPPKVPHPAPPQAPPPDDHHP